MAQPARIPHELEEPPVSDPAAIDRAYHFHQARRNARVERRRATRLARVRFWAILAGLFLACLVLVLAVWGEIQRLFGL